MHDYDVDIQFWFYESLIHVSHSLDIVKKFCYTCELHKMHTDETSEVEAQCSSEPDSNSRSILTEMNTKEVNIDNSKGIIICLLWMFVIIHPYIVNRIFCRWKCKRT